MAMTMHVDIVSAEEAIYSGPAEILFAPAEMGEVGILPRHAPLLTRLNPGEVRVKTGDAEESIYVSGGILEVQPKGVTILSDTAVRADDLDEAAAIQAKEKAEQALQDKKSEVDYSLAKARLAEAAAQLKMLKNARKNAGR